MLDAARQRRNHVCDLLFKPLATVLTQGVDSLRALVLATLPSASMRHFEVLNHHHFKTIGYQGSNQSVIQLLSVKSNGVLIAFNRKRKSRDSVPWLKFRLWNLQGVCWKAPNSSNFQLVKKCLGQWSRRGRATAQQPCIRKHHQSLRQGWGEQHEKMNLSETEATSPSIKSFLVIPNPWQHQQ